MKSVKELNSIFSPCHVSICNIYLHICKTFRIAGLVIFYYIYLYISIFIVKFNINRQDLQEINHNYPRYEVAKNDILSISLKVLREQFYFKGGIT